jgi:PiT family inorganic phosphate transporter
VAFFCAAFMAAGTALGGSRIIKRVALDMVRLDAPRGFAADLSAALCLAGCTALGLPVSTTHAKTCAVMGAGSAKQRGGLELRSVCDIIIAWLLTFPVCFFLGWGAAEISELFGGLS